MSSRSGATHLEGKQQSAVHPQAAVVESQTQVPSDRALLVLEEGMRRWYESCSCCLGDTYPEIKAQLDAQRVAAHAGPIDPGVREIAEAPATVSPS